MHTGCINKAHSLRPILLCIVRLDSFVVHGFISVYVYVLYMGRGLMILIALGAFLPLERERERDVFLNSRQCI